MYKTNVCKDLHSRMTLAKLSNYHDHLWHWAHFLWGAFLGTLLFAVFFSLSGLANGKLWYDLCQILWSLAFWIEWCESWSISNHPVRQTHATFKCNAHTSCTKPIYRSIFTPFIWNDKTNTGVSIVINWGVPFYLGLREPGFSYRSSVRGGHAKHVSLNCMRISCIFC